MSTCPSTSDLETLASRDEATPVVRRHVARCATCQAQIENIRANDQFLASAADDLAEALQSEPHPLSASCPLPAHDSIPGYCILEEISRGGQGVVYRAIQTDTKRPAAIKMLLAGAFATPRQRYRFERETELAANLCHPNIVTIFQSGVATDGGRYVAMEFVHGVRLDRHVEETLDLPATGGKARADAVMRLLLQVARGVGHAHTLGVIHRDIKPSNILIDEHGVARVLDFGLARMAEGTPDTHMTQDFACTPAYAAPERLSGQQVWADARGDVYSLGVVLYRLLTGHAPYVCEGPLAVIARETAEATPPPPSRYAPRLPRDVQTIVLQCLAKDPARRYANASALAEDIEDYLAGNPISARLDSSVYVLRKLILRNRPAAVAVGLALLTVLVATVGFAALAADLDRSRRDAESALSDSTVQRARLMAAAGDGEEAEALLWSEAIRAGMTGYADLCFAGTAHQLRSAWSLVEFYSRLPRVMRARTPTRCSTVGFAADAQSVWAIDTRGSRWTWALDGRLLAQTRPPTAPDGTAAIAGVFGSPNGRYVVAHAGGTMFAWDVEQECVSGVGIEIPAIPPGTYIANDGTTLYMFGDPSPGWTTIVDLSSGRTVANNDDDAFSTGMHHDATGTPVVLVGTRGDNGRRVVLRRPSDWTTPLIITVPDDIRGDLMQGVKCPTLSPDGKRLAVAVSTTIMLTDVATTPTRWASRDMYSKDIERIAFHASGHSLIAADQDGMLMNLTLPDFKQTCAIHTSRRVSAIALSSNSDLVAVTLNNTGIAVYEPTESPWLERIESSHATHASIACAPDGTLAWGDDLGSLHIRSPQAPHDITTIHSVHQGVITSVVFSPDGREIATAGFDGQIIVRRTNGEQVRVLHKDRSRAWCVRFSPDGRSIAACFQNGRICIWPRTTDDPPLVLQVKAERIPMIEFSSDGRTLVCAAIDQVQEALTFDVATGRVIHRFTGHGSFVRAVGWSPDGMMVVTSGDDRTLRVWDTASGQLLRTITGLPWGPYGLVFHPGGRVLFAVGPSGSIVVVDPHAGVELAKLAVHDRPIFSIALSPDGTKLFTSGEDSWIGITDLDHLRRYIRGNEGYWRSAEAAHAPTR